MCTRARARVRICASVHMRVYVHVHVDVDVCVWVYVRTRVRVCAFAHGVYMGPGVRIQTCARMCARTDVCTHPHTQEHMRAFTHAHTRSRVLNGCIHVPTHTKTHMRALTHARAHTHVPSEFRALVSIFKAGWSAVGGVVGGELVKRGWGFECTYVHMYVYMCVCMCGKIRSTYLLTHHKRTGRQTTDRQTDTWPSQKLRRRFFSALPRLHAVACP